MISIPVVFILINPRTCDEGSFVTLLCPGLDHPN